MLEKMSDFFEARLDGYDEHMMTNIESANEFYPFTAKQLPTTENCHVLDLGCGTGLELQEYYLLNPSAMVTGIDLSQGMLAELKRKFANKDITLMLGSYFDVPLARRYSMQPCRWRVFIISQKEKRSSYTPNYIRH